MSRSATIDDAFAPLVGQMAWQVRSDEHGCVMMELGAPHLEIREPMRPTDGSSAKVQRLWARRRVGVVGDWHLWIESGNWSLKTTSGSASSEQETGDFWRDWMDDVAGQHLLAVESPAPGALTLRFETATLDVKPDEGAELDSWSLHAWQGGVIVCDPTGRLSAED